MQKKLLIALAASLMVSSGMFGAAYDKVEQEIDRLEDLLERHYRFLIQEKKDYATSMVYLQHQKVLADVEPLKSDGIRHYEELFVNSKRLIDKDEEIISKTKEQLKILKKTFFDGLRVLINTSKKAEQQQP